MNTNEVKAALENAIADSTASDYDKGNILYLAEELVKKSVGASGGSQGERDE